MPVLIFVAVSPSLMFIACILLYLCPCGSFFRPLCVLNPCLVFSLQDLNREVSRFRDELWMGIRDLSRKTDLIVLVHNLSHKIPRYNHPDMIQQKPVLSLLLDEAKSLGIPWVLAVTNRFSVSAHQQKAAVDAVVQAYQASLSTTGVINSCPYVMPGAASASLSWGATGADSDGRMGAQKLLSVPMNLVRRPFQKKDIVLPVEGVKPLCQVVHRVLRSHEEASFQVKAFHFKFMGH